MILPKANQKSYGVVHTENYFSFTGFCKKVNSDEIQKVDIYLDNILIDTIFADKKLQKIEDIYDIEGFGFTYNLPEKYIGEKLVIYFKNHQTKEDLQNSPYGLIRENHPKFNEALFLNSLEQDSNKEEIREMYSANSIGFLATEENLNDTSFIEYIKEMVEGNIKKLDYSQLSGFKAEVKNVDLSFKYFKISGCTKVCLSISSQATFQSA